MDNRDRAKLALVLLDAAIVLLMLYIVTMPMMGPNPTARGHFYAMCAWRTLATWCGQNALRAELKYQEAIR